MKRILHIPTHHENGQPTYWPEMILAWIYNNDESPLSERYFDRALEIPFIDNEFFRSDIPQEKLHHIVPANFECDPGDDLGFLAVTPEGEKFPFAPIVKCTGVMKACVSRQIGGFLFVSIWRNTQEERAITLKGKKHNEFLINEGYRSYETFEKALGETGYHKLIHWTDKRY